MWRFFYSLAFYCLVPFVILRLFLRSRQSPNYRKRIAERFGFFNMPKKYRGAILVHAVSVGETVAAEPIIKALKSRYPDQPIIVTGMTVTGSERIKQLFGDSVFHIYLPYDLPCVMRRFFKKVQPKLIVIMETELWPNFIFYASKNKTPVLLANARLSEKSARAYNRFKSYTKTMLSQLTMIAAQAKSDAERFEQLGIPKEKISIVGSVKFDVAMPEDLWTAGQLLRKEFGVSRPVWIAGSTRDHEEDIILDAHRKIKESIKEAFLILVPRHPERFNRVADMCQSRLFNVVRRTSGKLCSSETDIYLGDTMGEMSLMYSASDVAFVGGSLLPLGGQNMLEPAALGKPIIMGPHLFNFAHISELLKNAGGLSVVHNADELAQRVIELFQDPALRRKMGEAAKSVIEKNRGSVDRHIDIISALLSLRQ